MRTSKLWLTLILVLGVMVLLVGTFQDSYSSYSSNILSDYFKLNARLVTLQKTTDAIETGNKLLRNEIESLEQSASYASKVLKDKYHEKGPNERIVFFAD